MEKYEAMNENNFEVKRRKMEQIIDTGVKGQDLYKYKREKDTDDVIKRAKKLI